MNDKVVSRGMGCWSVWVCTGCGDLTPDDGSNASNICLLCGSYLTGVCRSDNRHGRRSLRGDVARFRGLARGGRAP